MVRRQPASPLFPYTTLFRSYAHVTYFFNCGVETPYPCEERVLVPSQQVPTYDLMPEMSAPGVTDVLCKAIDRKSTRLNSSHGSISYAVFCLKKKKRKEVINS